MLLSNIYFFIYISNWDDNTLQTEIHRTTKIFLRSLYVYVEGVEVLK